VHRNLKSHTVAPYLALLLAGLVVGLTPASAQVGPQPLFVTTDVPIFPGAMIKLRVEVPQMFVVGTTGTPPRPQYMVQPGGRFQIQTSAVEPDGGNPTRIGDENRLLASIATPYSRAAWGHEYSSKTTIAVDTDPSDQRVGFYYDVHELQALERETTLPSELMNYWPNSPSTGTRDVSGIFRLPVAFEDETRRLNPTEWILVRQLFTVIGDTVQLEYVITNDSNARHQIGLRVLIDAMLGGVTVYDGKPIITSSGRVIDSETVLPDPSRPNDVLPDTWVAYDDYSAPVMGVRGTLTGTEVTNPGIATRAAGPPDTIYFGQMRNMGLRNQYYYTPNAQASLVNEDWAYAVLWNQVDLAPGESRRYVTYYGVGVSSPDYNPPYALMGYGPIMLQARDGDDPFTNDVVETSYLTDELGRSPFPMAAYMDNFSSTPLLDASVRIRLPLGLELAAGEPVSKSAGVIQRNEVKSVSWNVTAAAARPGRTEVRFSGPRGKAVTRNVNIPALPVLNPLPNATRGVEMISIPYNFTNTDAEWIFQSLDSLLPGGPASLIWFDPSRNDYRWFPDPATTNLQPGMAFWLLNRNREVVILPDDARPLDTSVGHTYNLKAGWNQIGNPFTISLPLEQVRVIGPQGGDWSMEEAVARNYLLPTVYAYDPATNQYTWELSLSESRLDPYMGYWLLARQDITLLFPPPTLTTPAQAPPAAVANSTAGASDWKFDVTVTTPGLVGTRQTLGVRAGAVAGLDRHDVPRPPDSVRAESVQLQSSFYPGESAVGLPYLVDTRDASQGPQTWNLIVKTNAVSQPVTVNWPSLTGLPSGLIATLEDTLSGQRVYMRTATGYTFRTGGEPTERLLKITVQPRPAQTLAVSGVATAQSGQGTITLAYTLSAEAAVDVRIRNISGVVVGRVASGQLSPAGRNVTIWSGQSDRGTRVPAGRYLCEITARSPETGQSVSVVSPVDVRR
jgi:hypothetical protein